MSLVELTEVAAVHIPILTTPLYSFSPLFTGELGGSLIARKLRAASDPLSRYCRDATPRCTYVDCRRIFSAGSARRTKSTSIARARARDVDRWHAVKSIARVCRSLGSSSPRLAGQEKVRVYRREKETRRDYAAPRGIPIIIRASHFCELYERSLAAKTLIIVIRYLSDAGALTLGCR